MAYYHKRIPLNRFERFELTTDIKTTKKSVAKKPDAASYGVGIAAQFGLIKKTPTVKCKRKLEEAVQRKKRRDYEEEEEEEEEEDEEEDDDEQDDQVEKVRAIKYKRKLEEAAQRKKRRVYEEEEEEEDDGEQDEEAETEEESDEEDNEDEHKEEDEDDEDDDEEDEEEDDDDDDDDDDNNEDDAPQRHSHSKHKPSRVTDYKRRLSSESVSSSRDDFRKRKHSEDNIKTSKVANKPKIRDIDIGLTSSSNILKNNTSNKAQKYKDNRTANYSQSEHHVQKKRRITSYSQSEDSDVSTEKVVKHSKEKEAYNKAKVKSSKGRLPPQKEKYEEKNSKKRCSEIKTSEKARNKCRMSGDEVFHENNYKGFTSEEGESTNTDKYKGEKKRKHSSTHNGEQSISSKSVNAQNNILLEKKKQLKQKSSRSHCNDESDHYTSESMPVRRASNEPHIEKTEKNKCKNISTQLSTDSSRDKTRNVPTQASKSSAKDHSSNKSSSSNPVKGQQNTNRSSSGNPVKEHQNTNRSSSGNPVKEQQNTNRSSGDNKKEPYKIPRKCSNSVKEDEKKNGVKNEPSTGVKNEPESDDGDSGSARRKVTHARLKSDNLLRNSSREEAVPIDREATLIIDKCLKSPSDQMKKEKGKIVINLGNNECVTRNWKEICNRKGEDISNWVKLLIDRLKPKSTKTDNKPLNYFITLHSRFKVMDTKEMGDLEVLPEEGGKGSEDPPRIYTTLSKACYQDYLDEASVNSIPELIVTRLYPNSSSAQHINQWKVNVIPISDKNI